MSIIKIAIQKTGRLNEDSLKLLNAGGISIDNAKDQLKALAINFPLEVMFLRNQDIPKYLESGIVDLAILGQNTIYEFSLDAEHLLDLNFSKCRLSLAVPSNVAYFDLNYFQGKRIATSYPNSLRKFLKQKNISADIHQISGSVELAPNIGIADAICDLVSSGNTLFKNGLKEVEIISTSEASLIVNKKLPKDKWDLVDKLVFRMKAVLKGKNSRYILLNAPEARIKEISEILPVLKSPTILPLGTTGWCSMHSVIEENKFWEVIDQLRDAGAEDLLIIPIEKLVK